MPPRAPPPPLARLEAARAAYADRRWHEAWQHLQACDAVHPLARQDRVRLAWAAGMLDRDDDLLAACERLFRECEAAGDHADAAYWAFFLGFRLLALREHGRASGWLQRARRQATLAGAACAVHGYLLVPQVIRHFMAGEWDAAAAQAQEGLAIAARCGDRDLEALARCWMGKALVAKGRIDEGIAMLDEAMLLALGDALSPVVTGLVYCNLIASCRQVYALDRAREWTAALARWCRSQPQLVQFGGACQLHVAEILELDGAWQESLSAAREATQRAQRSSQDDLRAGAAYQEGEIHRLRGDWPQAQRCYGEAHQLGMDPQPGLALVRLATGAGEEAVAMLLRSLAAASRPLARARLLPAQVEALLRTGATDTAGEAAGQLQAIACDFPSQVLQAHAQEALARVQIARGDAGGALPRLEQALATWLRLCAPYLGAGTRVQIALGCRQLGDVASMRLHLEAARDCFSRLGAAPALRQVEDLLHSPKGGAVPASLTARELQVLQLVAAGHTNKAVARELGLSDKTVDRHLANIFDKLEVHTRSAATAFAYQHGLVGAG